MEAVEPSHHSHGTETHLLEVVLSLFPFEKIGHRLNLIADFGVGGEITGAEAVFDAQLAGRLAFGGEVFGFRSFVHQTCCDQRNLPADSFIGHVLFSPRISSPLKRRWAVGLVSRMRVALVARYKEERSK
jgi:hypothetical protein